MPSLRQILSEHASLLVLDAASQRVQVGHVAGGTTRWASRMEEAGVGLFQCLEELDVDLGAVGAFAFCEGPGSILGIRTAAVALRVWNVLKPRPLFGYLSLAVAAQAVGRPDVSLVCDARRGLWHRFRLGSTLERVPAADLSGELLVPEGFRHWDPLPPAAGTTPYDLGALFGEPAVAAADLFRPAPSPDAFLHEEPSYAKWTPQIHRAP